MDKPDINFFNDTFNYLAKGIQYSIFLTSRYKKNRNHVININKLRRTNKSTSRNYLRKVINNFKSNIVIKTPLTTRNSNGDSVEYVMKINSISHNGYGEMWYPFSFENQSRFALIRTESCDEIYSFIHLLEMMFAVVNQKSVYFNHLLGKK